MKIERKVTHTIHWKDGTSTSRTVSTEYSDTDWRCDSGCTSCWYSVTGFLRESDGCGDVQTIGEIRECSGCKRSHEVYD